MNYLSVEQISKRYDEKELFEKISFGVSKGEKLGLIGVNGSGKSTLLRLLAGIEKPDEGRLSYRKGLKVGYLEQNPELDESLNVWEEMMRIENQELQLILSYERCISQGEKYEGEMEELISKIEEQNAWNAEADAKSILDRLGLEKLEARISSLSGGQKKRLGLAKVLLEKPDFLILDEPTNHLDLESIEWLEQWLSASQLALIMVTHDRFFLDRVCNYILELDQGKAYKFEGNYDRYLVQKSERQAQLEAEVSKAKNLLKKEMEWLRRMPKARGTKAKYRVEAVGHLQAKASQSTRNEAMEIKLSGSRQGKKVLELKDLGKGYDGHMLFEGFSHIFTKGECVGLIGPNGAGKSTLLNIIAGTDEADEGERTLGSTTKIGYYEQEDFPFQADQSLLEVVSEVADVIPLADGSQVSASQLLNLFLFPPAQQRQPVGLLSGGEKKRLQLLRVLMSNPTFLILDEPTNDLDIVTLEILEDYLQRFQGCLLLVSHDRYFMDQLVDHLFVLEDQEVKDFPGNYSQYRVHKEQSKESQKSQQSKGERSSAKKMTKTEEKSKLSYQEKKEYESLEDQIAKLEEEKSSLEKSMNEANLDPDRLMEMAKEVEKLQASIEEKTDRWLYLADLMEG